MTYPSRLTSSGGTVRVLALSAVLALASAGGAAAKAVPESFADLAENLSPAVVNISTSQTVQRPGGEGPIPQIPEGAPFEEFFKEFFDRQRREGAPRRVTSLGSGFVIDPSGIVVTNNHVIESADEIEVNFSDGSSLPAELLGRDPKTDLAVLKIEPTGDLPYVEFGNSDGSRVGEWVMAIGNPFGLGGSVSVGIISARNRDINAGPYDDFIQTDAAINRGNSGGPLFNMDGEVIGVNTAIISPTGGSIGIGFAIPSSLAERVVYQLRDFGETRRGWLGVRIQTVTDEIAESLGLDRARGALVAGVSDEGPASVAGIEQGDVIVEFDGTTIEEMRELPRVVADTDIGKSVQVELYRRGQKQTVDVVVGRLEEEVAVATPVAPATPESGSKSEVASLGMVLAPIDADARERYDIAGDVEGVLVEDVAPGSSASEKGIRAGDVIVEVAQEVVRSPKQVAALVASVEESDRKSVLLLLSRGGDLRFVAVRIDRS